MEVVKKIQKEATKMDGYRIISAIASYMCMAIGWLFLVAPSVEQSIASGMCPTAAALRYGFIYGFVLYGVFNFTNYTMFKNYTPSILMQDMLWGTSWTTAVTILYGFYIQRKV
jgi:uncharacterized membrane protein